MAQAADAGGAKVYSSVVCLFIYLFVCNSIADDLCEYNLLPPPLFRPGKHPGGGRGAAVAPSARAHCVSLLLPRWPSLQPSRLHGSQAHIAFNFAIYSYVHPSTYAFMHSSTHAFMHVLIHTSPSFTRQSTHPVSHPFTARPSVFSQT